MFQNWEFISTLKRLLLNFHTANAELVFTFTLVTTFNTSAMNYDEIIKKAYAAFNNREIDEVLSLMHENVEWPNGWEGGYVFGKDAVKKYWLRQWKELDPAVFPTNIISLPGNSADVEVRQVVKDLKGNLIVDGLIRHTYFFENGFIRKMEIKEI